MNLRNKIRNQTTRHLLMVRPAHFGFNEETAKSNAFQSKDNSESTIAIQQKAIEEFDGFVAKLRAHGIHVMVAQDSVDPVKPDAVFPNNWVTFHQNATAITYPMNSLVRRFERDEKILDFIAEKFDLQATFNFESFEDQGLCLEGTGSMILDRVNKIVYACLSPRTNEELIDRFCTLMNYRKAVFRSVDSQDQDIYHTNVMMALGETFAVICLNTIRNPNELNDVKKSFQVTGKEIIEISMDQMMSFAGNMLQVKNDREETFLVMSQQAYESLRPDQIRQIERHTNILYAPIKTIEKYGGGSARCMMAEVFLPQR